MSKEQVECIQREPFLFRFLEKDTRPKEMLGTVSGGPEDPRPPEPTRPTPWGD